MSSPCCQISVTDASSDYSNHYLIIPWFAEFQVLNFEFSRPLKNNRRLYFHLFLPKSIIDMNPPA
jgi:hypothetical protein